MTRWSSTRLSRGRFWVVCLSIWVLFFALREWAVSAGLPHAVPVLSALTVAALSGAMALRMHDRGRSAAWLAALLVPLAGAIWLAWELALRRGTPGDNRYGPASGIASRNHLTVR